MKVELLSITPDAEKTIEKAGRTCYLSSEAETEKQRQKFIKSLVKNGHHSVLEHAYATFKISNVSRALTHQLVRHRLCSYSQQSQRYVDESNFEYIEPDSIKGNSIAHTIFTEFIDEAKSVYLRLRKLGIKKEDAKFVLPNATSTTIVVTANFREWRHIIELRGQSSAQWEIRKLVIEILKILKKYAPSGFYDFEIDKEKSLIKKKG